MFTLHICVRSKFRKEKEGMNLQHSVMYYVEFEKLGSIQNLKVHYDQHSGYSKKKRYFCPECSY
ncbi:hypothetical protein BD408DRAFT_410019 [Parasitella parasitica]|nr:hypothetical protein BD408DRAFT_421980 [Parasitella parasitica]KAI8646645.1 hypothetical protein BD408DRAFT_410019 [Parasitella parasitica]